LLAEASRTKLFAGVTERPSWALIALMRLMAVALW
jgi:hypothetical protein